MHRLRAKFTLEIRTADPVAFLSKINRLGIVIYEIVFVNELTLQLCVNYRNLNRIKRVIGKTGGSCTVLRTSFWCSLRSIFDKRAVLMGGVICIAILAIYLQTHVLFIHVNGNSSIPVNLILQEARACGVQFGVARKDIRSEKLKNQLLERIPNVEWLGINTKGCVATISIREQQASTKKPASNRQVGNVVAICDGVILSNTVLNGTSLCNVGQAVTKGQILISGYTDCGMSIKASCAEAEILAQTNRSQKVVTPTVYQKRIAMQECSKRFSLQVGKKLIKLYKGSGISNSSCVKIYKQKYISLPGGFVLPVCFIGEYVYEYTTVDDSCSDYTWIADYSADYLKAHMLSGQIIRSDTYLQNELDVAYLVAEYVCIEMIGKTEIEERIDIYGFYN